MPNITIKKIQLTVLGIVLLFSVFLFVYFPNQQKSILLEGYNKEIQNIANTVALGTNIALTQQNFDGVMMAIEEAKKHPQLIFIALLQEDSILKNGVISIKKSIFNTFPKSYKLDLNISSTDTLIVKHTPLKNSVLKGEVVVGFSTKEISNTIMNTRISSFCGSILVTLCGLMIGFWLDRSISIPIKQLSEATKKVGKGIRGIELSGNSKDQMGQLINSFNDMINKLAEAENQIIQKNKELERLSIVASETDNVIFILDSDGRIEWVNSSFEKVNGFTLEELVKQKGESIFDIYKNPETHEKIRDGIREKRAIVFENINTNASGKTIWESSTLTPLYDDSGNLKKLIIINMDITETKEKEEIIRKRNKDITDSINYAQRIQKAMLASDSLLNNNLAEYFILFKPKDIVSGDFYWATEKDNRFYLAVCDSTGHGVPGAFMSLLNISFLNEAINEEEIIHPNEIFNHVRKRLIENISFESGGAKDGMDGILVCIDKNKNEITYAAANSAPLMMNGELKKLPSDKMPVGSGEKKEAFNQHTVSFKTDNTLYLYTDGFADQFGGIKGKKFKYKQLNELLLANHHKSMPDQKILLETAFEEWKGSLDQVDDVLIVGIKM
jgi:PAS domain S-box-containing protein